MPGDRFRVAIASPLTEEVRTLVAALVAHMRPLSPPEFQFQMTAEQMADASTSIFVARDGTGRLAGMGALKAHDASLGEATARALGLERLALETGSTAGFEPAWALSGRSGFTPRGAFLDYPDSAYNRFYEKQLTS